MSELWKPYLEILEIKNIVPRPYYLVDETIKTKQIEENHLALQSDVVFPLIDPSVKDRGDHVNIANHQFAVWNAAHILCSLQGFHQPRATDVSVKAFRPTLPDTNVFMEIYARVISETSGNIQGVFQAVFSPSQTSNKILEVISGVFIAQKMDT